MNNSSDLTNKHCKACEGDVSPIVGDDITPYRNALENWSLSDNGKIITKVFAFKNYARTLAFMNTVAWMAMNEGHHPDLEVRYNECVVHYTTHAIDGLSENDFICAAKVDAIFAQRIG